MTYCAVISVAAGLVVISDSRTNAGVDDVSTYSKMRSYGVPGERQFVICAAGNLATTQSVYAQVERDMAQHAPVSLLTVDNVPDAATYLGGISLAKQRQTGGGPVFEAVFLIAGEVAGAPCRACRVYPEGNHISSSRQTPYLQIGEAKYGKPVLDRIIDVETNLEHAALCALLSMDATTRSNLTVGPPIELNVYTAGSLKPGRYTRFGETSPYLAALRETWSSAMRDALQRLPPIVWDED